MTRLAPLAGLVSVLLWPAVPAQAEDLRVCLLEDDLPRADRTDASGFDHDLFREAARRLGRDFVPAWRPNAPPYSEIDDTDLRALDDLRRDGTLDRLASQYGIFRTEAFSTVSSPAAIRALGIGGE